MGRVTEGGRRMAVSSLLPRKAAGGKPRRQALRERVEYDRKGEKTRGGELVTSYMCSPETAAEEFEMAKLLYEAGTGRSLPADKDIIAYRILQSFPPGEITPEEANKLGFELAMEFTKGQHQFVVSTHTDKAHVHNHIEFNSTNLACDGKFKNFKDSALALRRVNDQVCREHGYSVIENPEGKGQRYQERAAAKRGRSYKERLRRNIDRLLPGCKDFEEFLARMRAEGYEVKRRGKSLEFREPGQERFTRSYRLGEEYREEVLKGRILGTGGREAAKERLAAGRKGINLFVDIRKKMEEGKGKGYEQWAKVFNLKEAANTLNFLVENGISDYDALEERAEAAGREFDTLAARIKQLEGRMAERAQLRMHVINYSRTREVYKEYRKSCSKEEFYEVHGEEIKKHEAAKAAFDALGGKAVPKVAQLTEEYGAFLAEKRACYEEYKKAREEMKEYWKAKQNVDRILGMGMPGKERQKGVGR